MFRCSLKTAQKKAKFKLPLICKYEKFLNAQLGFILKANVSYESGDAKLASVYQMRGGPEDVVAPRTVVRKQNV
ncbi:hypothetical protein SSPH_04686 [Sporomusa sphaeroides DSM 2875]|uniref:Uncharacterized protein n=1 Tax=Sporomusa sphaeroides DSM 2875 TaxID=1337886 RepID=A0ABP2CCD0_9FIRM|nr:hypothetical protein SSPH_04686 [Sporomusa sphaeroides DSM 2875]